MSIVENKHTAWYQAETNAPGGGLRIVNDGPTMKGSITEPKTERIVFLYLSGNPKSTAGRIQRFYRSVKAVYNSVEFRVVSYMNALEAGTFELKIGDISILHHIYNHGSLVNLGYRNKLPRGRFNFNEGYVDLPIILFWRDHPNYDRYWVAEDDVEYTGDIGTLLQRLDHSNAGAELSCTHLRLLPENWDHIHTLSSGDDQLSDEVPRRVCFLPFFCVGPRALAAIDAAYKRGWAGHNEMTWAMILDHLGMPIRDIGGTGPYVATEDRNRCYLDHSPNDFSKHGSFGTMTIRLFPGRVGNILWHPVKTPKNWIRMNRKRLKSILQWYRDKTLVACRRFLPN